MEDLDAPALAETLEIADFAALARLVDAGALRTTMTRRVAGINAANLREAHAQIESGTTQGKIVLEGFG